MKGIKKLIISLLALVIAMGASVTAFAEGYSISVEDAIAGQTYDAYRVFDYVPADENNAEAGGVYKLNAEFAAKGFASYVYTEGETSTPMSELFTVGDAGILDTTGLGTVNDSTAVKTFGKAALAFAKANNISKKGTVTAAKEGAKAGEKIATGTTIEVDAYGYYVVDSSLGTAVAVDTTTPNATIKEKNDVPSLDKEVTGVENRVPVYDKTGNDAQIGDKVDFKITANLKVGGEDYVIVDVLDDGLTLDTTSIEVAFEGAEVAYTVENNYVAADGKKGFKVEFTEQPTANTTAIVTYKATVNTNALIHPDVNINEAYLIYGHDAETTHITTETKTYPMILKKVIKGTQTVLAGAHFDIYRASDNTKVKFRKVSDTEYVVDPDGTVTDIETVETTPITLKGFNTEEYVLVETQAPVGYNLLEQEVKYTLPDGSETTHYEKATVTAGTKDAEGNYVAYTKTIENGTGNTLPSTGGIGTTIFYIVGGILIVAGVAYFIVRRKADAK